MIGYKSKGNRLNDRKKNKLLVNAGEKLLRILMVTVFAGCLYGIDFIHKQIDGPLSRVIVVGDFINLKEQELAELVEAEIDGGFLSMNLNYLREQLQNHPWIHEVSVRREWPSTLKVEVIEEVPIARWGHKGFLNRLGERLELPENSSLKSLPIIESEFGTSKDMIKQYQIVSELLTPTRLKLAELQRDSVGAWQVDTVPGIKLVLGREQIVEKIRRFVVVWRSGLEQHMDKISSIDLRYPNGIAVSWKDREIAINQDSEVTKANYSAA
jgi:cell division protein FtsQ